MWEITFLLLTLSCCNAETGGPINTNLAILTSSGQMHGKFVDVDGQQIRAWLGIPYARPPVGKLRFQKPQPAEYGYTLRYMDGQPKICHQTSDSINAVLESTFHRWDPKGVMSEDCLYLNVYAPEKSKDDLSTIVWIHGGGFYKGSVSLDMYNPKYLVAKEDVIVVSIQYRIGSFGLLYMGEDEIPGNMGLLDQAMAIKWIHENIKEFGGDPNKITLMGESAGSASVGYHMISEKTRDLFQSVILMSGSPFNHWAYTSPQEARNRSLLFASYASCKRSDFKERRACLLALTPEELLAADKSVLPMTPTIDGDFITQSPSDAIRNNNFQKKNMLAGLVQNEGMPGIIYFLKSVISPNYKDFSKDNYDVFLRMMSYFMKDDISDVTAVGNYYLKRYESNYATAADMMFGDFFISCGTIDFINNVTKGDASSYFYYFNHRSLLDKDPEYTEVMHGGELQYLFGRPFAVPQEYNENDRQLSERMMKLWATFSKTGKPSETWGAYDLQGKMHNYIQTDKDKLRVTDRDEYCAAWPKYSSYYETVSVSHMCEFIKNAVWEGTNWFTYYIGWWISRDKYCYDW